MVKKVFLSAVLLAALAVFPAYAGQGIKGRAALGGTLVESVDINVYPLTRGGFGPFTGTKPVAGTKTALDGTYSVTVPEGRYVVEAIKKGKGKNAAKPEAGDLYCLYSGSPVTVTRDKWTNVGLYLTPVGEEKRGVFDNARIRGRLTFKGEPVERAYLYGYATAEGFFHGPADFVQPVAKGNFSVNVPPGKYYLVARKRAKGGMYGPIEMGDKLNFYAGNPLVIGEREEVVIEIPMAERLSSLEEDESTERGRKIKLVDADGKPLASFYVLAYGNADRSGPPAATSALTDKNGETFIHLPPEAKYLRGRATLGGPLSENETYIDGEASAGVAKEIILKAGKKK